MGASAAVHSGPTVEPLDVPALMATLGRAARAAAQQMAVTQAAARRSALLQLAHNLRQETATLLSANQSDLARATRAGLNGALFDRLQLSASILETCAQGCEQLAAMPDIIGAVSGLQQQPSGIRVGQMRVPIGVFGMIYESRPNVTIEAASLSIKSANACILRCGSEALASAQALTLLVQQALLAAGLPSAAVQLVPTSDRAAVDALITMPQYVDVIIPRGGRSLIERVNAQAKVPVIQHLDGNCHSFVDASADIALALRVCDNAKTQKYSPCNAMESLLVHRHIAPAFLPQLARLYAGKGVEMRCCPASLALLQSQLAPTHQALLKAAVEDDWYAEYLAPIISIRIVDGVDSAIAHINQYSSHHTDAILSQDHNNVQHFLQAVDSASVMVNTSTRFADGFEYGLGAEIGISTNKLHARGPVGVEGLTSLKYVVYGQGEVRH